MELVALAALGGLGWLWLDGLKAREAGVRAGHEACAAEGLQLLDDTVAFAGIKLARDGDGRVRLQRVYNFEFTDTGNNRLKGSVVLLGHEVILLNMGLRDVPNVRTLH